MVINSFSQRTRGVLAVLAAALIWGTIPMVLGQVDGDPIIKVFYRIAFGFLGVSLWMLVTGTWRTIPTVPRAIVKQLIAQGIFLAINWALFLSAFEYADVAIVELLGYVGPALVPMVALLMIGEPFDRRIILPLALSFAGTVVILASHGLSFDSGQMLGAGLALASSLTYAVLTVRSKAFVDAGISTSVIIWYDYLAGAIVLLPLTLWAYAQGGGPTGGLADYSLLLLLGFFHTAFAISLFLYGLRHLRVDQSAVLTYMEPASAVILAAIFMGQPLHLGVALGGLLVIVGGTLVARMEAATGIEITPVAAGAAGDCDTCEQEA